MCSEAIDSTNAPVSQCPTADVPHLTGSPPHYWYVNPPISSPQHNTPSSTMARSSWFAQAISCSPILPWGTTLEGTSSPSWARAHSPLVSPEWGRAKSSSTQVGVSTYPGVTRFFYSDLVAPGLRWTPLAARCSHATSLASDFGSEEPSDSFGSHVVSGHGHHRAEKCGTSHHWCRSVSWIHSWFGLGKLGHIHSMNRPDARRTRWLESTCDSLGTQVWLWHPQSFSVFQKVKGPHTQSQRFLRSKLRYRKW